MAEEDADNSRHDLNEQNRTIPVATGTEESDNYYEELNKQTNSDYLKLKEMEEGCLKMRKEIALLKLDVASSCNPHFQKAQSIFESNVIKASETVQEIERIMSSEVQEISKLLAEC